MAVRTKRRPTHPGELLREETLPAANLSPAQLADRLGVSSRGINDLLRERRSVTPDLAHRLARVFNTTPEFWLRLEEAVDILGCLASKSAGIRSVEAAKARRSVNTR